MKKLTKEEYINRTAGGKRTAVFREYLADRETPVAALSRLGADEEAFLLESVSGGERRGRYSYLGLEPRGKVSGRAALEELRGRLKRADYFPAPELPSFQGGAVGYVAYEAVQIFEPRLKLREATPPFEFLLVDTFLIFDNVRDTVTIVTIPALGECGGECGAAPATPRDPEKEYDEAQKRIESVYERLLSADSIRRLMESAPRDVAAPFLGPFESEMTKDEFCAIVEKCKAAIRAGEVIQIVPSQKFTAKTDLGALALYRALRTVNPSPYNFYMRIGSKTLIGSSPEELVKLSGRTASTAPIAGTRPRSADRLEDARLERELAADEKERAEHIMLVDLARNDLGRVCEPHSVKVESLAHVERFSHVMHLVSNVKGTLAAGLDAFDLVKAAFPAGTLSGAPKVRAMELISDFEKSPRGEYGGAAGYFSLTGDMDLAIIIRTMVLEGGKLSMRSGAGIVADSIPEKEYEETLNKARAAFSAARFALDL